MSRPCVDEYGNEFKSVSACAKYHKMNTITILRRFNNGKKLTSKITPINERNVKKICYKGITYNSIKEFLQKFNMTSGCYYYRLKHNVPLDKEVTYKNRSKIEINGVTFNSHKDAAKFLNISAQTLSKRLSKGL